MKRILSTILFFFFALCIYGQSITLSFIAKDAQTNDYIALDTIKVDNLTLGCDTVLFGPNPKLVLPFYVGIHENMLAGQSSLQVMPNVPNPFDGTTFVTVYLEIEGKLVILLSDLTGKNVARYSNDFESGFHQFEVAAYGSGIFVLHAYNGKETKSIRLINTSGETDIHYIKYLGSTRGDLKSTISSNNSGFLFNSGDQLQYTASALGYNSEYLLDSPKYNAVYTFLMTPDVFPPSVTTATTTATSSTTATSGGRVTADGGGAVTARGVCLSTSPGPTVDLGTKTSDSTGTGSFTSSITGLTAGTTYYVRAYATNIAGTGYGEEVPVTTPTLPSVTTATTAATSSTTATSGGTVSADGGSAVTSRGVCWSTSPGPTADLGTKTSDSTGTGLFTSSITGLTAGTTYYVRAYATNIAGTGYGEEVPVTTPTLPSVTTATTAATLSTIATSGGTVNADGGSAVTARGVCWNTSPGPTADLGTKTSDSTGTGSFTSSITGLTPETSYHVRAYAINDVGTAYGDDLEFTTPATSTADWEGRVMTVNGLIPPDSMGITLPHEHLLIVHKYNYLDLTDEATAITELGYYVNAGGKTLAEASVIGIGRNPEGLKRISTATGTNVIMSAGYYKDLWVIDSIKNKSVEQLTEIIINDIIDGINGIHAGFIKIAMSNPITPFEEKVLIAAARAQIATGAALDVHFDGHRAPTADRHHVLDVFENEGVDLTRVYLSHCVPFVDLVDDFITLAQRGCYLAFDMIGLEVRVDFGGELQLAETLNALIDAGYIEQILISQDVCFSVCYVQNGGYGYAHILNNIIPQLKTSGITDEQIHTMMVENPKGVFPFKIYTDE